MNSDEHYKQAERYLRMAVDVMKETVPNAQELASFWVATAQVHATLATTPFEQVEVIQR